MSLPNELDPEGARRVVDDPEQARAWLRKVRHPDFNRGRRDLGDLGRRGLSDASLALFLSVLHRWLPGCPDPVMALTNLDRFLAAHPQAEAQVAALAKDGRAAELLIQFFSTSQHFSEQLIRDPSLLDWVRHRPARRDRESLVSALLAEIQAEDDKNAPQVIRSFKAREMLRIGHADIVRGVPLEVTALDLSNLAEACIEAAYHVARRRVAARHGEPPTGDGAAARFVVLALGKLGGAELNYSSDIDLIFLHDEDDFGRGGKSLGRAEFFARVGGEIVRLLSDLTPQGQAYRVDMRLRPEGAHGPLSRSLTGTLAYYENSGRVWERQALIKCRPVAGSLELGRTFVAAITPFIYRRYLGATEIGEIRAMKRRIESRTASAGAEATEVKTGRGGIRDVEFVVQFLQLLHGGSDPGVRHPNTLTALALLEQRGGLTVEERSVMEETYRFLRMVEHRLQTMFDRQIHEMPRDEESLRALALRLGYAVGSTEAGDTTAPTRRFLADYRARTEMNREILNHLLHDAFGTDDGPDDGIPVVDLVLDPEPPPEAIRKILAAYGLRDPETAYRNLVALAREEIEFLSTARCRHFFAAIAPRLLQAVARTPDPDLALTNLERVSASLGAKAILWELFQFQPRTLELYVELCGNSQLLTELLIGNPGMIDELMDSLVVDRPQTAAEIKAELAELCRGAEDPAPILRSFRNKEWVRIGTRDILSREPIRDVTRELSDVAEAIVTEVARIEWARGVERHGWPHVGKSVARARWAILGLGKLGGRELNYHSDLDLIFLYESDGMTRDGERPIPNEEFFVSLVKRVLRLLVGVADHREPLYQVDTRLRPHGQSGAAVVTLGAFRDYFSAEARGWERMALTRGRILYAAGQFGWDVHQTIRELLSGQVDPAATAREVVEMKRRLEETSKGSPSLRHGPGGLREIEFLVHYLQLVHSREHPEVLRPNIWDALDALGRSSLIDPDAHQALSASYSFLRSIESRLRIAHNRPGVGLPTDFASLARLAMRLGYAPEGTSQGLAERFLDDLKRHAIQTQSWFERYVVSAGGTGTGSF